MPLPGSTSVTPLQNLIEQAVENMFGPWTAISGLTGYTSAAEVRTAPGGKIELRGTVTANTGDLVRNVGLANLPTGFRPTADRRMPAVIGVAAGEGPGTVSLLIQTTGNLLILSGTSYVDGSVLYLDGIVLPL